MFWNFARCIQISGLILCSPELVDTLSYQMRSVPILVLPVNTARTILVQVLAYLRKSIDEARRLSQSLMREKKKAQDEKIHQSGQNRTGFEVPLVGRETPTSTF